MSNQINVKLIKTISILCQLQKRKLKNKINPHNHNNSNEELEESLGLSVIDQLNMMNKSKKILLNIGGMPFITYQKTLASYPHTLLGKMFFQDTTNPKKSSKSPESPMEYFFDRDWTCFKYILQYYRYGKIFWPSKNNQIEPSREQIINELNFFKIPYSLPVTDYETLAGNNKDNQQPAESIDDGEQEKNVETNEKIVLDRATKNLDLFIQMVHRIIHESRSNFKNEIEITFFKTLAIYVNNDSTTYNSNSKKSPIIKPQTDVMQSLINPFKKNGFEILELFGNEISKYFMELNNHEIDNNEIENKSMSKKYEVQIIKSPNCYRMHVFSELNTLDKIQIIENSILNEEI